MKSEKRREINTGRYLGWSLVVSVILGLLVGSLTEGVVWFIVTSLAVAAVAFFLLFWGGVVVAAVCGMTVKEESKQSTEPTVMTKEESYIEDDSEYKIGRKRALKRVKRMRRDYPDCWEILLDPDDEYYCYDYISDHINDDDTDSSDMVFGISHSDSHSDDSGCDSIGS